MSYIENENGEDTGNAAKERLGRYIDWRRRGPLTG